MKKKYILILSTIALLIIGIISFASGYYKYVKDIKDVKEEAMVININSLSINYSTGNEFNIKKISDNYVLEKKISVTNMGDTTLYYTINLDNISYQIKSNSNISIDIDGNNDISIKNIEFPTDASELTDLISIAPDTTQSYVLKIIFDGEFNPSDSVSGTINIIVSDDNLQTFSNLILLNNMVQDAVTQPGKSASTTNEGLIESLDDDGTTYYFRGKVDNNYVSYADLTWRIIRINGNGSVRLILDDEIDSNAYNSNELEEGREDYYTLVEYRKSSIKELLDKWYETNISKYSISTIDSKFCSDTNISEKQNNDSYYSSYIRTINEENPSFTCKGEEYFANIGLLSVDELIFAGAYHKESNKEFYLSKDEIALDWWTGSPSIKSGESTIKLFTYNSNSGRINLGSDIKTSLGIRPVISLRNDVRVTGTGTIDDPYVIQ